MGNSQTYPQERVRIFDRNGYPLAEFRADVSRSLVIGEEGRAEFTYPSRKTDVVNERVLQYGNWLLVQSDVLPDWVGVIDTPREWSPRAVAVHAYTPERVFSWRRGPLERKLTGSAGAIFSQLLVTVNQAEATVIRDGNIWRGGIQREETINPTPLSEDLQRIYERSGEEYNWRPTTDNRGMLIVYADWVSRIGVDTTALLHEGKSGGNIEALNNIMVEDGEIVNDILAYGDGMSWTSKPNETVRDTTSIHTYGLRQVGMEFTGVTNKTTLRDNGNANLLLNKNPSRTYHVNALNVGGTFSWIGLGNRLTLRFENIGFTGGPVGFETSVRIVGLHVDSSEKNKVELVLDEIL